MCHNCSCGVDLHTASMLGGHPGNPKAVRKAAMHAINSSCRVGIHAARYETAQDMARRQWARQWCLCMHPMEKGDAER